MSSITPYQGHSARTEAGTAPTQRTPAAVMDAAPGLRDAAGQTLQATVIGRNAQGHLMLRSDSGMLALMTNLNPPRGSTVTVQLRLAGAQFQAYILRVVEPGAPAQSAAPQPASPPSGRAGTAPAATQPSLAPPPALPDGPGSLTRAWPALEAALGALSATNIAPLLQALPQPGPQFGAGLLFVLTALNGGDLRMLLGRETRERIARAGGNELLNRLEQDFTQLSRLAREGDGEWRLFTFPVVTESGLSPLRLFIRGGETADGGESPQRFVAEADLAQLGEVQLDGLVQPKRFDLMLRSRVVLDEALQKTLYAIFGEAKALGGYSGSLHFAAGTQWKTMPVPAPDGPRTFSV